MSLYGKTDSNANVTKAGRGIAASSQAKQTIFVDETEAALAENKARGLNAPGWWSYYTFTDSSGATRHKAEMLVTLADAEANSSESQSDDAVAADRTVVISSQPALTGVVAAGAPATFTVSASIEGATGGSITAQWQVSNNGGSTFTPISSGASNGSGGTYQYQGSGFTGQELLSTSTSGGMGNYQYRVVLSTAGQSGDVTSDAVTLTFN
jgi:hypothetical protein